MGRYVEPGDEGYIAPRRRNPESPVNYQEADEQWVVPAPAPAPAPIPRRNPESPVNYQEADKDWATPSTTPPEPSSEPINSASPSSDVFSLQEKKAISAAYFERKAELAAQRQKDNAILDAMGLRTSYGASKTEGDVIFGESLRTGRYEPVGRYRSGPTRDQYDDTVGLKNYTFSESPSGVRIYNEESGLVEVGVRGEGDRWVPESTLTLEGPEPVISTRTTLEPFKIKAPASSNTGALAEREYWVLPYSTRVLYRPGDTRQYELAKGPSGKTLSGWGGYSPSEKAFIVTTSGSYAPSIDTLGEVMAGRPESAGSSGYLDFIYGKSRMEEFAGYAVTPVERRTVVDVVTPPTPYKMGLVTSYDIGGRSLSDFDVEDFKRGGEVSIKSSPVAWDKNIPLVGGGEPSAYTSPSERKDFFGHKSTDLFYFDAERMQENIRWGGMDVNVDSLSYGLFNWAEGVNRNVGSVVDTVLPAGHVRNIGGTVVKTIAGIPTGMIMVGASGAMLTEIAAQRPKEFIGAMQRTPGLFVEAKQYEYQANPEAAFTSDVLNVGLIGMAAFSGSGAGAIRGTGLAKTRGVRVGSGAKGLARLSEIQGVEVVQRGGVKPAVPSRGGADITGGILKAYGRESPEYYYRPLKPAKPSKPSFSDVTIRETPKAAETKAVTEQFTTRDMMVQRDAAKYWGRLGNLETEPTGIVKGDLTGIEPKGPKAPTRLETRAEDAFMSLRSMRAQRDAAKYYNRMGNLETESPGIVRGDMTGIEYKGPKAPTRLETRAEDAFMSLRSMRAQRDAAKYWGRVSNLEKDAPGVPRGDMLAVDPQYGIKIDKNVMDYSRIYPVSRKAGVVERLAVDLYLKQRGLGDVLSTRQQLVLLPRTKPIVPRAPVSFGIPRLFPGVAPLYGPRAEGGVLPEYNIKSGSSPVIMPKFSSLLGTVSLATTGIISKSLSRTATGTRMARASRSMTSTLSLPMLRQATRQRTVKPFKLYGSGDYGSRYRLGRASRTGWEYLGIFDSGFDMDFGLPYKSKKGKRGRGRPRG